MLTLLPPTQRHSPKRLASWEHSRNDRWPVCLALWLGLASLSAACSVTIAPLTAPASPDSPAAVSPAPSPAPAPVAASPAPAPVAPTDPYQAAIGTATGAVNISRTAVSREDWRLAASRWERAIQLLQTVPQGHAQYAAAQQKIPQYQQLLADAQLRGTPPPPPPPSGDAAPPFFSAPIKWKAGGIPIIDVKFDGKRTIEMAVDTGASGTLIPHQDARMLNLQPVATKQVTIADGSIVGLPIAPVRSIELDGRIKRNMIVAIAPPSMPIGLLGHDFYDGYDITIKDRAVEFRRRDRN